MRQFGRSLFKRVFSSGSRLYGPPEIIVIGLGNPGPRHEANRHNIGFMAVDAIVRRHGFGPWRARHHGLIAEGAVAGRKLRALSASELAALAALEEDSRK